MMTHKIIHSWEVVFADGTARNLELTDNSHHYIEAQKYVYLLRDLEGLIYKYSISSEPIELREKLRVIKCEPYVSIIGI